MHPEAYRWGSGVLKALPEVHRVLEYGCRNLNGTLRGLIEADWIGLDRIGGPDVDIVADACVHRMADRFDCVVCTEVFEHEKLWRDIVSNASYHLRPGGYFVLTCAGPERPSHSGREVTLSLAADEHYANVMPDDLRHTLSLWFQQYIVVENRLSHDLYAFAIK